jgi:diguanylate cyclase (GGDEF)-like protein
MKSASEEKKNDYAVSGPVIMLVDDEPITLEIIRNYLEKAGYSQFVLVSDATEAMEVLEETDPDILLLDLIMPKVSGLDILAQLRKKPKFKYLPIIILTASKDPLDKIKALDLGATDFLAKPVDPTELALRIRNTAAAKAYQDYLTFYDTLTDLPNKSMFLDRFDRAIRKAKRDNEHLALLHISLDDFDKINATIGAAAADQILPHVAYRIEQVVREIDVVVPSNKVRVFKQMNLFRVEGSAFSLLLDRIHGAENAAIVANRIITAIREPFNIEGTKIYVKASIGIANYPEDSQERDTLSHLACGAKDYIKKKGGDYFQFSNKSINDTYIKRHNIENMLSAALERDEFELNYQPKVDIESGMIKGVEALLRWERDGQSVPPDDFVPVAEQTGLIVPIGEWLLTKAFRQLADWHNDGIMIGMNVNLSARQLQSLEFIDFVEDMVQRSNVDPLYLTLEITESLLMADIASTIALLERFKDLGLKISIDDFGTGYSSLNYLNTLPVHELKIDRSFIQEIPDNEKRNAIVATIIYLSESLGIQSVAEGVENERQLQFLKKTRCHQYQGYLFSKPLTNSELLKLVRA